MNKRSFQLKIFTRVITKHIRTIASTALKGKPWNIDELKQLNKLIQFNKRMSDSIWSTFNREEEDSAPGGLFISNKDFSETPRRMTLVNLEWREQRPETPDVYKTKDGKELLLSLEETVDGAPVKRAYTAKGMKTALLIAMKQAGIEIGDTFEASRFGSGIDMRFTVNKVREDGAVEVSDGVAQF